MYTKLFCCACFVWSLHSILCTWALCLSNCKNLLSFECRLCLFAAYSINESSHSHTHVRTLRQRRVCTYRIWVSCLFAPVLYIFCTTLTSFKSVILSLLARSLKQQQQQQRSAAHFLHICLLLMLLALLVLLFLLLPGVYTGNMKLVFRVIYDFFYNLYFACAMPGFSVSVSLLSTYRMCAHIYKDLYVYAYK